MQTMCWSSQRAAPAIALCVLFTTCVVLTSTVVRAQNVDVFAERVSMDMNMLQALRGDVSIGKAAVWPTSMPSLDASVNNSTDSFAAWVRRYYHPLLSSADTAVPLEFAGTSDGRFRLGRYNDGMARLQIDAALMARGGTYALDDSSDVYALLRPSLRFAGSLFNGSFGYFLDLSNGVRFAGTPTLIARTDPTLGRTLKFVIDEQKFFDRYVGYVQYQHPNFRLRFGREPLQVGFSPIDNFMHSLNAPMMDGLLIDVPYGPFRFTSTHSLAEGTDTSGLAVPSKYIATHRVSVDPASWLNITVSDMIVYYGRGLDFSYLNPLAFFVSAGLGTQDRSAFDNSLLGVEIAVRPMKNTMLYGSLIIDDLSYSTLSDTSLLGNNNKFAYQLGASGVFDLADHPTMVTLEFARIDPFTFSHRRLYASYTTLGAPVGYDMQPNSDRMALQVRHWFTPRTFVRLDLDYTRHGENLLDASGRIILGEDPRYPGSGVQVTVGNVGGDILRGDGDFLVGNRFLRGNVSHMRRLSVWFSSELWPNIIADVRAGYTNRNGGNTPGSFLFTSLEVRIGY